MTHIQNTAPGPPARMAAATPTMLPVPMVAASAVQRLWNWLMASSSVWAVTFLSRKMAPMVCRIQYPKYRSWKKPVRTVSRQPVPNSSASPAGPHTTPPTTAFTRAKLSHIHKRPLCSTVWHRGRFHARAAVSV